MTFPPPDPRSVGSQTNPALAPRRRERLQQCKPWCGDQPDTASALSAPDSGHRVDQLTRREQHGFYSRRSLAPASFVAVRMISEIHSAATRYDADPPRFARCTDEAKPPTRCKAFRRLATATSSTQMNQRRKPGSSSAARSGTVRDYGMVSWRPGKPVVAGAASLKITGPGYNRAPAIPHYSNCGLNTSDFLPREENHCDWRCTSASIP